MKKIFVTRKLLKENEEKLKSIFEVVLNQEKLLLMEQLVSEILM